MSGTAKGRAECTLLGPGLLASKPALTDSSVAAKRRAEALHVCFFQPSIRVQPSTMTYYCCCCCIIRSHERRALGALPSVVSRSEPASTDS